MIELIGIALITIGFIVICGKAWKEQLISVGELLAVASIFVGVLVCLWNMIR